MPKPMLVKDQRSITEQIAETENRILERQRLIASRRTVLTEHLRQRATSPAVLLLAGGIGFIVGELTRGHQKTAYYGDSVPAPSPLLQVAGTVVESIRPVLLTEFSKIVQGFSLAASTHLADQLIGFFNKPANPDEYS